MNEEILYYINNLEKENKRLREKLELIQNNLLELIKKIEEANFEK